MAQLSGVKTVSETVIEYGGKRYERTEGPAQVGDILRMNIEEVRHFPQGSYYCVVTNGAAYGPHIVDEDGDRYRAALHHEDFTRFRPIPTTAQLIEAKRAELAALEAQFAEEQPKVGDYVRCLCSGEILLITAESKRDKFVPYWGIPAINREVGENGGWLAVDEVQRLTPVEARAALIAQVEALFEV